MTTANTRVAQILLKRGNTIQSSSYVGPLGEVTLDTGLDTLRIHDGTTAGGFSILATKADIDQVNNDINNISLGVIDPAPIVANVLAAVSGTLLNGQTAANVNIARLDANLGTATTNITTLLANANTQEGHITSLTASVSTVSGSINSLLANAVSQATLITSLQSNAASQSVQLADIVTGQSQFGNIIPSANVIYTLGNVSHQWKELWLSGNTIYINNVPLSVDDSGNLLLNGNLVNEPITTDRLVNGEHQVVLDPGGELSMPSDSEIWFNYGYVGQSANIQDNAFRVSGGNAVVINTSEDGVSWQFTASGNLVLPTLQDFMSSPAGYFGGNIIFGDGTVQNSAAIYTGNTAPTITGAAWYNTEDGRLYVNANGTWQDASPAVIPGNMVAYESSGDVELRDSANLIFPDSTTQTTAFNTHVGNTAPASGLIWYNTEDGRTYNRVNGAWVDANPSVLPGDIVTFNEDGNVTLPAGGQVTWANGKSLLSGISANSDRIRNGSQILQVQNNGSVRFPDGTTQDTAYTGLPTDITAYFVAGTGNSYDVPGALRVAQNDANWAFGFVHPGNEEYYTRTTFWGASFNERGFQVYDNSINQSRFTVTGTGNVVIGSGGQIVFADGTVQPTAYTGIYSPEAPLNWSGTPPTTISQAIDRLAAVVKSLNSGVGA